MNVIELIEKIEHTDVKENKKDLENFDKNLRDAAFKDLATYVGEFFSFFAFHKNKKGKHSIRTKNILTYFGWTRITFPYFRKIDTINNLFSKFNIKRNMTKFASVVLTTLSVRLGSFKETVETIKLLSCGLISESKIRNETLIVGEQCLQEMKNPKMNKRTYTTAAMTPKEGENSVEHTIAVMSDGTCVPCVKQDTEGRKGKNRKEAGSRQLRVTAMNEFCNVSDKGVPIPIKGSFSYFVLEGGIEELTNALTKQGHARGAESIPRLQCLADGEEALELAMREAFSFRNIIFTNDIIHACEYLHKLCEALGIENVEKEYKICKRILYRIGASSVIKRIKRCYSKELEKSMEAQSALGYLEKRKENMNYGWLRKNGYYISSAHAEAAARILVARRCKQVGMHWRHHNAACVCAIIAVLRSAV